MQSSGCFHMLFLRILILLILEFGAILYMHMYVLVDTYDRPFVVK